jgi:hypothetical protein
MEKSNVAFPPFLEGKMEEFSHFKWINLKQFVCP